MDCRIVLAVPSEAIVDRRRRLTCPGPCQCSERHQQHRQPDECESFLSGPARTTVPEKRGNPEAVSRAIYKWRKGPRQMPKAKGSPTLARNSNNTTIAR